MNTMFKKCASLIFSIAFIFSLAVPCLACTIENQQNISFDPKYIGCPEGGKHLMRGIGYVACYEGDLSDNTADFYGFGTQCTKCYLVLVTEYPANVSTCTKWGKYVTCTYYENVGSFTKVYNATYAYSTSINGQYEQGFEFILTA